MRALTFAMRFLVATGLLCITGFCVFGFLASFEIGPLSRWQLLYGAGGIGTFTVAMHLCILPAPARAWRTFALLAANVFCVLGIMESCHGFSWPSWGLYGALGCGCLAGAVASLGQRAGGSQWNL